MYYKQTNTIKKHTLDFNNTFTSILYYGYYCIAPKTGNLRCMLVSRLILG